MTFQKFKAEEIVMNVVHTKIVQEFSCLRYAGSKRLNNEISIIGGTTTHLGDYDFIELYEGQIIAEFSERFPMFAFDLENNDMFQDRELWTYIQKEKYNQMKKLV